MGKKSKDLVPVGTHVPLTTKMTLQAMAESQDTTVYALIQEWIEERVAEYGAEIDALKEKPTAAEIETPERPTCSDDEDLLS